MTRRWLTWAWGIWAAAQVINVTIAGGFGMVVEDVSYYFRGLTDVGSGLNEYPDASIWPLHFLYLISGHNHDAFVWLFLLGNITISGLFLWYLTRKSHSRPRANARAGMFWALFNLLLCPLVLTRMDLAIGMTVAAFVIVCGTRWALAAPLILSFATMLKLSPGVLAATLVGRFNQRNTWLRLLIFAVGLALTATITMVIAGPERLLSPLNYQSERGLQVESVSATPFVVLAAFIPGVWDVHYSSSKSYEIFGPGVDVAVVGSTALMVLTLLFALGVAAWQFLRPAGYSADITSRWQPWNSDYVLRMSLAITLLIIVTNKVFSPQYLMWAAPLISLLLLKESHRTLAYMFLAATFFSAVIFPWMYTFVTDGLNLWGAALLLVRNVLILWVCYYAVKIAVRSLVSPSDNRLRKERGHRARPAHQPEILGTETVGGRKFR